MRTAQYMDDRMHEERKRKGKGRKYVGERMVCGWVELGTKTWDEEEYQCKPRGVDKVQLLGRNRSVAQTVTLVVMVGS